MQRLYEADKTRQTCITLLFGGDLRYPSARHKTRIAAIK
jgi:hypothetical protein